MDQPVATARELGADSRLLRDGGLLPFLCPYGVYMSLARHEGYGCGRLMNFALLPEIGEDVKHSSPFYALAQSRKQK
jgi:hypothetical protein